MRNLEPGETYRSFVRRGATETLVCEDEANRRGVFTCNAQQIELPGFVQAVVRDSAGMEDAAASSPVVATAATPSRGAPFARPRGRTSSPELVSRRSPRGALNSPGVSLCQGPGPSPAESREPLEGATGSGPGLRAGTGGAILAGDVAGEHRSIARGL